MHNFWEGSNIIYESWGVGRIAVSAWIIVIF